jgi:hypothetical protein
MCLASIVMTDVHAPVIIDFSNAPAEASISRPSPERVLEGSPQHSAKNFFSDASGQFFAGVWESTPGRWLVRYSENEFCHITRGKVLIEDGAGRSWTFKAGDSFVVPAGFAGSWTVLEPLSKLYAIFEAASK